MGKRYVTFTLGSGRYCVPVDQVLQILRFENLIEIPKPPPFVDGVINLRGDILPVVNLRRRLEIAAEEGASQGEQEIRKRRIVVTRVGTRSYGLAVDEVREIVDIEEAGIQNEATSLFGARADFIQGIARRDDGLFLVLDLPSIFSIARDAPGAGPG